MTAGHRPKHPTERRRVLRIDGATAEAGVDTVVVEEPMEIRVGAVDAEDEALASLAVTMRTPGNDFELAAGFVVTEGIADPAAIRTIAYCGLPPEEQEYNIVTVRVAGAVDVDRHRRNVFTTSSCGICGKATIDMVDVACDRRPVSGAIMDDVLAALPDGLRRHQSIFEVTGGLHGAGLFDLDGAVVVTREDIGRHNAVDKVIGWAVQQGFLPLDDRVLVVSGRLSFEIAQKAAVAGVAIVVAVSAPSSLAVSLAERLGVTLVGFTREDRFTVYAGGERVRGPGGRSPEPVVPKASPPGP